ncbi:MAG: TMF family protein, partial [Candidatus Korarchaeum sp.]
MSITPELYEFIVKVVEERTREIRVTREEFEKLREVVRENTEAIDQLRKAVAGLEKAVERLVEAQAKSEERLTRLEAAVEKLAIAVGELRVEVGRLSDTVGYGLEDVARMLIPYWLERDWSIRLRGDLRREFLRLDGEEVEVDLYSEGAREGEEVRVVGEVRSRIYGGDVRRFYSRIVNPLRRTGVDVIAFMLGYVVHPSAREEAERLGMSVIAAYEL